MGGACWSAVCIQFLFFCFFEAGELQPGTYPNLWTIYPNLWTIMEKTQCRMNNSLLSAMMPTAGSSLEQYLLHVLRYGMKHHLYISSLCATVAGKFICKRQRFYRPHLWRRSR